MLVLQAVPIFPWFPCTTAAGSRHWEDAAGKNISINNLCLDNYNNYAYSKITHNLLENNFPVTEFSNELPFVISFDM